MLIRVKEKATSYGSKAWKMVFSFGFNFKFQASVSVSKAESPGLKKRHVLANPPLVWEEQCGALLLKNVGAAVVEIRTIVGDDVTLQTVKGSLECLHGGSVEHLLANLCALGGPSNEADTVAKAAIISGPADIKHSVPPLIFGKLGAEILPRGVLVVVLLTLVRDGDALTPVDLVNLEDDVGELGRAAAQLLVGL